MIKKSLHKKLLISMLLATLIPFLISNIMTYRSSAQAIEENLVKTNRLLFESGMNNLIYYFNELNGLSLSWIYNEKLMEVLSHRTLNIGQRQILEYEMKDLMYRKTEILRVRYYKVSSESTYYSSKNSFFYKSQNPPDIIRRMEGAFRLFEIKKVDGNPFLIIHRKIVEVPNNRVLGYLSLYISPTHLNDLLKNIYKEEERVFLSIGQKATSFYSVGQSDDGSNVLGKKQLQAIVTNNKNQGVKEISQNGETGIVFYEKESFKNVPLTLVKYIPQSAIVEAARQPLAPILLVQIVAVIVMIVFIYFMSYSLTRPVKRVLKNIQALEKGQFKVDEKANRRREDELGLLENRFENMVRRLDQLITIEYRQRIEVTTAQLKMLQAQINPHFLYNTLQSIGTVALKNNLVEIYERIVSLSSIFRYSMDMKTESVPLKREIENIQEYLYLQKGRFGDKLSYDIECTDESLQVPVPKMILQPLVENSVVHGVENGNRIGNIKVNGSVSGERIVLEVSDDGPGMSEDTIRYLRQKYKEKQVISGTTSGIGLINVLFRLSFEYGEAFDWSICSEPYKQTSILLRIPVVRGK